MKVTRRDFLTKVAAGVAALPLLGRGSVAWALPKVKVGYMKIANASPFIVAMEKGFFREEGLEVEAIPFVGGAAIGPALAAGELQIGFFGTVPFNQARDTGLDFQWLVGGNINEQWLWESSALIVLKGSPIRAPKDMVGKRLAPNTLYSMNHLFLIAYLVQHSIDPSKVRFMEVPFPQQVVALQAKRVDVASNNEPFITAGVLRDEVHVISHNWSEVLPRFNVGTFAAPEKWIKANRESVRAFIRGYNRGLDYVNSHLDELKSVILPKWTGVSQELSQKIMLPRFDDKRMLVSDLQPTIDLCYEYKFIKRRLSAEDLISELAPRG